MFSKKNSPFPIDFGKTLTNIIFLKIVSLVKEAKKQVTKMPMFTTAQVGYEALPETKTLFLERKFGKMFFPQGEVKQIKKNQLQSAQFELTL